MLRRALGDERHFMLECPQFDDVRTQYADLLQDARAHLDVAPEPEGPV